MVASFFYLYLFSKKVKIFSLPINHIFFIFYFRHSPWLKPPKMNISNYDGKILSTSKLLRIFLEAQFVIKFSIASVLIVTSLCDNYRVT